MMTSLGQYSAAQVNALGVAFSTDTTLLAGQSPLTVFAPTNEAFEALPKVDLIFSMRMMMKDQCSEFSSLQGTMPPFDNHEMCQTSNYQCQQKCLNMALQLHGYSKYKSISQDIGFKNKYKSIRYDRC